MNYLSNVRRNLLDNLWEIYKTAVPQARLISDHLQSKFIKILPQDHCAIVDLPSEHSGTEHLKVIFEILGFCERGRDYLPEKQNDFVWMTEIETLEGRVEEALSQVIVADFRLNELPKTIQSIVEKYCRCIKSSPLKKIEALAEKTKDGDFEASKELTNLLTQYLNQRDWPLPSVEDFEAVKEANELLAWTLALGRMPNHFTLQVHRISPFNSLSEFNQYLMDELNIKLNDIGGMIKGSPKMGIEQSSTVGEIMEVKLSNGVSSIANRFIEFVWRHPLGEDCKPEYWKDYFNDFIATNANHVIESLYSHEGQT